MSALLKTLLSMSASGGLLILVLLLGKRHLRDRLSRQWQYYIWLVVILRLLVPFGTEASLLGRTYQAMDQAVSQALEQAAGQAGDQTGNQSMGQAPGGTADQAIGQPAAPSAAQSDAKAAAPPRQAGISAPAEAPPARDPGALLGGALWLVWLAAALGLLVRRITAYRSFLRCVRAGSVPVSDPALLDRLSAAAEGAGVRGPVDLWVNPLVSSPMLVGFFRPCIVLPAAEVPEKDFPYIVLHELTHYRRRDLFYKWLVQITVCLHWFNPLVHRMSREIARDCEFSCDEAVLARTGVGGARDYGETLLDAMAASGRRREALWAVTLSENKELLKERLCAIMSFERKSPAVRLLTLALTLCLGLGAVFAGIYPAAAAKADPVVMETARIRGDVYYLVQTEAQLRAIGTGRYGLDQNYMQQADIPLSPAEWKPIGTRERPFTGTFNGNGFAITGLTMTDPYADLVGLFGVAAGGAEIYNVTLRDCDILQAGRNAPTKSVGAVLAIARGGSSYDNSVYSREVPAGVSQTSGEISRYYEAGSLPLFQIAFSRLDPKAQGGWLNRIYRDQNVAALGAAAAQLGEEALRGLAETAYRDGNLACFSILARRMCRETQEAWLDRALAEGNWAFQSTLFDMLDRNEEFDKLEAQKEKEWEAARKAEYGAAGITVDGKNYYYQGALVNVFLDIRANGSFYTLDMNPKGTINIRVLRDAGNRITGVVPLTEAELEALFLDGEDDEYDEDDEDDENDEDVTLIPVSLQAVKAGGAVDLGAYPLSRGSRIRYDVSAETGRGMQICFARDQRRTPVYWSIHNLRQGAAPLACAGDFTVSAPAEPGTYRLYLLAPEGPLGNVQGTVSITAAP